MSGTRRIRRFSHTTTLLGFSLQVSEFLTSAPADRPRELSSMAAHLMNEAELFTAPRVRLSGPNYRGQHRSAVCQQVGEPGTLVLEPASHVASSVIVQID